MNMIVSIIDSLLGSFNAQASSMPDPTLYQISTRNRAYEGYIIFQDDVMMKFRTTDLKPVKILKANIIKVTIAREIGPLKYATA
jgi:hypothetical protein